MFLILVFIVTVLAALGVKVCYAKIKEKNRLQKEHWLMSILLTNPYYSSIVKREKESILKIFDSYINISLTNKEAKKKGYSLFSSGFIMVTHSGRRMEYNEITGVGYVMDILGYPINDKEMLNLPLNEIEQLTISLIIKQNNNEEMIDLIFCNKYPFQIRFQRMEIKDLLHPSEKIVISNP